MKTTTAPLALQLELRHTFDAPVERVFNAWTDLAQFGSWLGCKESTNRRVVGDVRVGGVCRFEGENAKGSFAVEIKFREIVPNSRLVFSWTALTSACCASTDGETTVTVTFRALGSKTEVHLVHQGFTTDESHQAHTFGWTESLENLTEKLA